jgi:hypothetical protein
MWKEVWIQIHRVWLECRRPDGNGRGLVLFGKFSGSHQLGKGDFVRNLIRTGATISHSVGYRISHIEVQRLLVLLYCNECSRTFELRIKQLINGQIL